MNEPLTEEQLKLCRLALASLEKPDLWDDPELNARDGAEAIRALLAEVERLRAERNTLAAYLKITDRSVKAVMEHAEKRKRGLG